MLFNRFLRVLLVHEYSLLIYLGQTLEPLVLSTYMYYYTYSLSLSTS